MNQEKDQPRKRRTVAEIRAYHEAELKRLASQERAEVHKLVADAHDRLDKAMALPASAPVKAQLTAALTACKQAIPVLEKV